MTARLGVAQASHLPTRPRADLSWQADALCAGVDTDLFFPEKGALDVSQRARQVCAKCEVTKECLDYALTHQERFGVWGGLTERQRRDMERARRSA